MDAYIITLRQWGRRMFYEPHHIILLSLIFLVASIPIVTVGPVLAMCLCICKRYVEERKVDYIKEPIKYLKKHFIKALILWVIDIVFIGLLCLSVFMALYQNINVVVKYIYLVFALLDLIYLVSGLYRYPILISNDLTISQIIVQGILLCLNNFLSTFMFLCILLILLIVCIFTRVGIILILPGGTICLMILAFKNIITKYNKLEKKVE